MAITVSNVSVVQGTGALVKESVLEVTFNLAADGANNGHTFTIEGQIKLANSQGTYVGGSWVTGYLHGNQPSTGISPGNNKKIIIKVPVTLNQANIPQANYANELSVQVRAKDESTSEYGAYAGLPSAMTLKANPPAVTTATMPHYIGNIGSPGPYNAVPCTLAGNDGATPTPGNPNYYRMAQNPADLADGTGTPLAFATSPTFAFLANDTDAPSPSRSKYMIRTTIPARPSNSPTMERPAINRFCRRRRPPAPGCALSDPADQRITRASESMRMAASPWTECTRPSSPPPAPSR